MSAERLLPRHGRPMLFNLLYCLGFLRVSGQIEGALAVDRDGAGKIHRAGDDRADATVSQFRAWLEEGAGSEASAASLARIRRIHDHYAERYSFSNETMVHTIALFTLQFEKLLRLVGAPGYEEIERQAQVAHWRVIGERLGAYGVPQTWEGMEEALDRYEASPAWYGPTPEAHRCASALIDQFTRRRLPPGLRWAGRLAIPSLLEDKVLWATGLRKPSRPVVWTVRRLVRTFLFLDRKVGRR